MSSLLQFLLQFVFLLYISINGSSTNPSKESSVIHFDMIHKHAPELMGGKILSRSDRIKELLHGDKVRMEMISHKGKLRHELGARRRASRLHGSGHHGYGHGHHKDNFSFSLPMLSGIYASTATYYVPFRVGTPAQKFLLVADTGSDITWVNCHTEHSRTSHAEHSRRKHLRTFHSERSRTFRTVPCSTKLCREGFIPLMSTVNCPTPKSPCTYSYGYTNGAFANGIFAHDSVTVNLINGRKKKIPGILIGCTHQWKSMNPIGLGNADGILGLSMNTHTFVFNVLKKFRGKFSYCLVDHLSPKNISNFLTFGHKKMPPNMKFTELGNSVDLYGVTVDGIYVDGVKLDIPGEVWDLDTGRGMVVDSGFSLTAWVQEAYDPIMAALEIPLLKRFSRAEFDGFESCFEVPSEDKEGRELVLDESLVPKLEIEFKFGARFQPPVKSYFLDVDDGVRCIMFTEAPDNEGEGNYVSILGNIMQQNYMWEFDTLRNRLGFAPSSCELRHHHHQKLP
ncbi:aspartic proteinase NANA, chloroplast-like [Macadamia integrifolia]|uniref:aspartic proteinase NANA, chloroplast-like n=1 Tax=Macadamia integrifolia TaxID=60698 RepID=UPI001C52EAEE|nr:aspartic proteinase NANA, chloroplast-like [Macadamia integrifolia]